MQFVEILWNQLAVLAVIPYFPFLVSASDHFTPERELQQIQSIVEIAKALSDPTRLRILRFLRTGQQAVTQIADGLGIAQYNVSKHLAILSKAGLLTKESLANKRVYKLVGNEENSFQAGPFTIDLGQV